MSKLSLIVIAALVGVSQATIQCQVEAFGDARRNYFLATTEKRGGAVTSRWIPDGLFNLTTDLTQSFVRLEGTLVKKFGTARINMNYTFTNETDSSGCFCASDAFGAIYGGNSTNPDYAAVAENCRYVNVFDDAKNPAGLGFCPRCESGQCQEASSLGATDPIWSDWKFYSEASGTLSGPGMAVFRRQINRVYPQINQNDLQCPPSLKNQPLAQFGCDEQLLGAIDGSGNGVNAKNQECGMSFWYNCENDLNALGQNFRGHQMDVNLRIVSCEIIPAGLCQKGAFCDLENPSAICTSTLETFRETCVDIPLVTTPGVCESV